MLRTTRIACDAVYRPRGKIRTCLAVYSCMQLRTSLDSRSPKTFGIDVKFENQFANRLELCFSFILQSFLHALVLRYVLPIGANYE